MSTTDQGSDRLKPGASLAAGMRVVSSRLYGRPLIPLALAGTTLPLAFALLAGPAGAVAGLAAVALAVPFGAGVAILVAHLLAVLLVGAVGVVDVVVFETAMAPLLAAPLASALDVRDAVAAWLAAIAFGGVVVAVSVTTTDLWLVATTLVVVTASAAYLVHRIELVTLELVDTTEDGA